MSFKNLLATLLLRFAYLLLAKASFAYGVFAIGVRLIGDNPGALVGGVYAFLGVYAGCVAAETLVRKYLLEKASALTSVLWSGTIGVVAVVSLLLMSFLNLDYENLTLAHYAAAAVVLLVIERLADLAMVKISNNYRGVAQNLIRAIR